MKKKHVLRFGLYILGMVILAAGLTLNTKVTLGVSPIISVAYCISELGGWNLGDVTFLWYSIFVLAELLIHGLQKTGEKRKRVLLDLLQIPISLIFTRFMNLFSAWIPTFEEGIALRLVLLVLAIVLTGVGAAMSLDMRIIPNPGDGIVQTIADAAKLKVGTTKNIFDIGCVALTAALSLLCAGKIVGIGVGTIAAMIGTGRVIAVFNHLAEKMIQKVTEI